MTRAWTWVAIVAVLALSAGLDGALDAHVDFPGYYAAFGFVAAVVVILASTGLGALGLRRPDRDDPATGSADAPGDDPASGGHRASRGQGGHG